MTDVNTILNDSDVLSMIGYASPEHAEALLGAVAKMPAAAKQNAIAKIMRPSNIDQNNLTSRGHAVARMGALPKDIQAGLVAKRLQLADTRFYFVKVANAVASVRMIASADVKAPGVCNVNGGKLEKDNYFLLTGLILLSGVAADPLNAAFSYVPLAVDNGDFEFKAAGNKYLLPKDTSCQVFDTSNRTDIEKGLFKLDSPKWIEPQVDIEMNIRFSQATAANTNLKLILVGMSVINY